MMKGSKTGTFFQNLFWWTGAIQPSEFHTSYFIVWSGDTGILMTISRIFPFSITEKKAVADVGIHLFQLPWFIFIPIIGIRNLGLQITELLLQLLVEQERGIVLSIYLLSIHLSNGARTNVGVDVYSPQFINAPVFLCSYVMCICIFNMY